ncbi:MAG TPA: glycosyltransferase family 2 protein [Thermoleophilaceae bacterium]
MTPRWAIVVLSWNGRDDTIACLASTRRLTRDDVVVICVDNGSDDGSADAVRSAFPEVELIETGRNLGFAGGNNAGIARARELGASWIVLLNNDATIAPDAIDGFEQVAADRPGAGVLAGKVLFADPPDRIWFAGQRFNAALGYSGRPRGYGKPDGRRYDEVVAVDRAVGALMAVSSEAIDHVGVMDDRLFAYVEDVDWCLRMRAGGYGVVFAPGARAWHRVSASGGGEHVSTHPLYYGARNTIVVCERHAPLGRVGTLTRRAVVAATFGLRAVFVSNRRDALRAASSGVRDAIAGRLGKRPSG